ncbi:MAG TPA: hypothetical protein VMG82_28105 [Candidatus Sulfotelmatobacter sp.]|nr:hypothetical protein [Candidatus Sulfotelmatobacter sp.]
MAQEFVCYDKIVAPQKARQLLISGIRNLPFDPFLDPRLDFPLAVVLVEHRPDFFVR